MISTAPIITNAGKSLLLRAIGGEFITFTRFKIGNGELEEGSDGSELTDLINSVLSFSINSVDTSLDNSIKLTGSFDSSAINTDFRWRELGVFCEGETTQTFSGDGTTTSFIIESKPPMVHKVIVDGIAVTMLQYDKASGCVTLSSAPELGMENVVIYYPDGIEKLYAYANDGDNAGMMKANMTAVVAEQTVALIIAIGDAENVTAVLSQSLIYATKADFDAHINASNPHKITAKTIGLGNVVNKTPEDMIVVYEAAPNLVNLTSGETLKNVLRKLAKAVKVLIEHIGAKNPHNITASTIGATRVVKGSYTGRGVYGINNSNTISFDTQPKFVVVMPESCDNAETDNGFIVISGVTRMMTGGIINDINDTETELIFQWTDTYVKWYSTRSANRQCNSSGDRYYYVLFY